MEFLARIASTPNNEMSKNSANLSSLVHKVGAPDTMVSPTHPSVVESNLLRSSSIKNGYF